MNVEWTLRMTTEDVAAVTLLLIESAREKRESAERFAEIDPELAARLLARAEQFERINGDVHIEFVIEPIVAPVPNEVTVW